MQQAETRHFGPAAHETDLGCAATSTRLALSARTTNRALRVQQVIIKYILDMSALDLAVQLVHASTLDLGRGFPPLLTFSGDLSAKNHFFLFNTISNTSSSLHSFLTKFTTSVTTLINSSSRFQYTELTTATFPRSGSLRVSIDRDRFARQKYAYQSAGLVMPYNTFQLTSIQDPTRIRLNRLQLPCSSCTTDRVPEYFTIPVQM